MNSETFKLSKLRNIALAGILAAGVVGPTYVASTAHADDAAAQATQEQTDQSQQSSDDSNSFVKDLLGSTDTTDQDANDPTKTETVYVFNNADGSARNAIVTDWLKNVKGDQSLSDVSNLTDIENTESQAGYQQDGQNLTWDAQGNDIYYKGNTTEQAPVSIKVTYWLDGQEISPDDLAGKSGHVKIRYDYTNNASYQTEVNGEQRTMYTPFVAATGLILDNGTFKNVSAVNGKIVNDGDRTTVAGFAMPGLQEDLGISTDDVEIPTYFELEADVTDFSLDTSLTAVSSNLFDNVNTDNMSEDTIGDDIAKMNDAMNQLIDGSSSLYDGLTQLADGAGQLDDGLGTLQDSTASLPDSANQLNSGAQQVASGAGQLSSGASSLAAGTTQLASGTADLPAGVAKLYDGSNQVDKGLKALKNGDSKNYGLIDAKKSADKLTAGAGDLASRLDQLADEKTGLPAAAAQMNALSSSVNSVLQIIPALNQLETTASSMAEHLKTVEQDLTSIEQGMSSIEPALTDAEAKYTDIHKNAAALQYELTQLSKLDATGKFSDQIKDANSKLQAIMDDANTGRTDLSTVSTAAEQMKQAAADIETLKADIETEKSTLESIASNIETAKKTLNVDPAKAEGEIQQAAQRMQTAAEGAKQLDQGAHQLQSGLYALSNGTGDLLVDENGNQSDSGRINSGLAGAVDALGSAEDPATLLYGSNAIWKGLAQLNSSAPTLANGVDQVNSGAQQLASGSTQLASGSSKLADGTDQLASAMPALVNGIAALKAGSSQLASGAVAAQDGSAQLSDGLKQFNDEAIQKIVSTYNDDLAGLSDNLKATAQAGKDYQTFSGKSDDMQGKVTFIYETDSIGD